MTVAWQPILRALHRGPRGDDLFNPYRDEDERHDRRGAARQRRRNLKAYLNAVGRPRVVLVGEAMGYRGARFSGIAFTSERQLAGAAPLGWAKDLPSMGPTSRLPALWTEPSATIVWRALRGEARGVLLWNALPWHPPGTSPLSNRTPEWPLVRENLHVLRLLRAALPARVRWLAVGRTAERALGELAVANTPVRHPARGGAPRFTRQVAEALAR